MTSLPPIVSCESGRSKKRGLRKENGENRLKTFKLIRKCISSTGLRKKMRKYGLEALVQKERTVKTSLGEDQNGRHGKHGSERI